MNIHVRFLHKLLAGFGITGLIMVLIFLSARSTLLEAVDLIDQTMYVRVQRLAQINHLQSQANKIRIVESELPKLTDIFAITGAVSQLFQDLNSFEEDLRRLIRQLDPAKEYGGIRLFNEWRLYLGDLKRTVGAVQDWDFERAERVSTFYSRPRFQTFAGSLQTLSEQIEVRAQAEHLRATRQLEMKRRQFLWISLTGILLGFTFALLLSRSLSARLRILRNGAMALARGELKEPMSVHGRDEVADLADAFNTMQHQVQQRTAQLEESEVRFRSLVETTSDWIWEIDAKARYTYTSPKVRELLLIEPDEILGRTVYELMPPGFAQHFRPEFVARLTEGLPFHSLEKRVLVKDGSQRVMETSGVPIFDGKGDLCGFRGIDRDVTARKRAEEALHQAHANLERRVGQRTAELAEANRELDSFVYTLSHDLRTPLSTISTIATFFKEQYGPQLDAEAVGFLDDIEVQSDRMLELMEDLLELARIGRVARPPTPLDSGAVVADVTERLRGRLRAAGMTVLTGEMPGLRVPRSMLTQIFDNLIANAIRYGGEPGSAIEVGGASQGATIQFFVRDHGPGVAEKERERIFSVFYRGTEGQKIQGTGVGLATVSKIARLFGGRAWVDETPGGGATFRVEMTDSPPETEQLLSGISGEHEPPRPVRVGVEK